MGGHRSAAGATATLHLSHVTILRAAALCLWVPGSLQFLCPHLHGPNWPTDVSAFQTAGYCGTACSLYHKRQGKERLQWSFSVVTPSTFFFPCLSALCWGDLTPAKLVLLAFQPLASGWVNEEGEGGFWKVKGESTGLSLPCSPRSFHQHVSTCKCDLHDQSSLRRHLLHSFCSQGAQNTIFSPNPFSLGLPLAASLYKPLASLSVPLTCPHSVNSLLQHLHGYHLD